MAKAINEGCYDFLPKPITRDLMIKKVSTILLNAKQKKKTLKLLERAQKYKSLLANMRRSKNTLSSASPSMNSKNSSKKRTSFSSSKNEIPLSAHGTPQRGRLSKLTPLNTVN